MILWALATVGMTLIVVESPLFAWPRKRIGKPFSCYTCMGFWSGIICWLPFVLRGATLYPMLVLHGFAGSFVATLSISILEWLGRYDGKSLPAKTRDDSVG